MSGREALRRAGIWLIVVAFFATSIPLALHGTATSLVGFAAFPIVGAVILTSRPGNGVGWYLMVVTALCLAIMWGLDAELTASAPPWAEAMMTAISGFFWSGLISIGAIYPTGRAETRLGRIGFWGVMAVGVTTAAVALVDAEPLTSGRPNPFAIEGIPWLAVYQRVVFPVLFVGVATVIVVDVVRRWRRAGAVERLQYRWFMFGLGSVIGAVAIAGIVSALGPGTAAFIIVSFVASAMLNLIPISIGIAVTRHGLYGINRVVSRTVSYIAVTALVIGVYAIVVTSATWLLPELPSVGVAVATLAAAAVFLPVLRRVQSAIDRRFDRERYDAEHVVDAFGERLRTRVDPGTTTDDLVRVVDAALQPASVGLWRAEATR